MAERSASSCRHAVIRVADPPELLEGQVRRLWAGQVRRLWARRVRRLWAGQELPGQELPGQVG